MNDEKNDGRDKNFFERSRQVVAKMKYSREISKVDL